MRSLARLTAIVLAAAATPGLADQIGNVAAVNADVTGTPPAATERVLQLSDELVQNELIVSSETGTAQFLFLDQTSLTVSPRSEIVLDRYVYDPAQGQGEIAIGMTKGVLRFIGGRITKEADADIHTPIATIGVRGGISLITVTDDLARIVHAAGDYTRVSCPEAASCVGPSVSVSRPNAVIEVRPGEAPRFVGTATASQVGEVYDALSRTGGGGARNPGAILAGFGQGGGAVPAGGESPYRNPISTSGESTVGATTLAPDPTRGDTEFRTLAFSDPHFLGSIGGGGFVDVGGQGTVRGQLVWRNDADLDLHLFLPNGAGEVFFGNTQIVFNDGLATATLDADNLGGTISVPPDQRVENITVTGEVPPGSYEFLVNNFSDNGNPSTPFTLTMTPNGGATTTSVTGALGPDQDSGRIPLIVGPGS